MLETQVDLVILKTLALINKGSQQFLVHHLLLLLLLLLQKRCHVFARVHMPKDYLISAPLFRNVASKEQESVKDAEKPSADALRDVAALAAEDAVKFKYNIIL